jgi:Cytochrome C oxidase, cbb3-type, subunit III
MILLGFRRLLVVGVVAPLVTLTFSGCSGGESDPDLSRPSEFGFQTSLNTTLVEEGRNAYQTYCIGCHGETGDGNGVAARFLRPRPRNFQVAKFRFSSTRSGRLPSDEDLRRTIMEGLKGSAMPGWDMIPARTVNALIAYIKTFSPRWKEKQPATAIPIVDDPYRSKEDKSEAIARGRAIYHGFATCWTCHPSYASESEINAYLVMMDKPASAGFRPNLMEADAKPNQEGEVIYPPDFHRDFVRAGGSVDDLYRSIAAGISGTAMPTWVDSMVSHRTSDPSQVVTNTADLWAIAYYVQSLILERPARLEPKTLAVRERTHRIYAEGEAFEPVHDVEPMTTDEDFEGDD